METRQPATCAAHLSPGCWTPSPAEAQTFLASLRAAIGLSHAASLESCTKRLDELLRHAPEGLASMLPSSECVAAAHAPPACSAAVVVEVDTQKRGLQEAARVAVERMAARRGWPQVQIFVPARRSGAGGGAR